MRLHLLQAIVSFYNNQRFQSENLLLIAETELKQLKVSEESVVALIEMGKSTERLHQIRFFNPNPYDRLHRI